MNLSRNRRIVLILATGGLLSLVMIALAIQPGRAAGPWYVTPGGDDGNACTSPAAPCATINGAITRASSGDTIYVAMGTYTSTTNEVVLLYKSVTLSGGWDASFSTQSGTSTIDGEETRRGMAVSGGVTAAVERFIVQHGSAEDGGGIFNDGGTVTINSSIVSDNMGRGIRTDGGELILNDTAVSGNTSGGIYTYNYYVAGTVTVNNSAVSGNAGDGISTFAYSVVILNNSDVSGNTGRGISHGSSTVILNGSNVSGNLNGGIACTYYGTLTINNSTVSDNIAEYGGGIYNQGSTVNLNNSTVSGNIGGGILNYGTVNLSNSTVSGNIADRGGGINNGGGTVNLSNSTVSGNTADRGGGISTGGTLTLNNSTVSDNRANADGGGILAFSGVTSQNSILSGNTAGSAPDCSGTIGSAGYNLIGDTSGCTFTSGTGDLVDVEADLGQLIGLPGATKYHPLWSSSPAIDAGNPVGCTDHLGNPLDTDQRDASRVGPCDMGAYEYTTPGPAASIYTFAGTPQHAQPFGVFETPLQALVLDSIGSPVSNTVVTFSAPASGASGTFADSGTTTTTALTSESGLAIAATFTANGLEGNYVVTATASGVVTTADFLLGNIWWYVVSGGDDENDCQTPAAPCATINGALGRGDFLAGDTVLVAIGTYTGTGDEVVFLDKDVTLSGGWNPSFTTQSGTSTVDGEGARRGITVNSSPFVSTTVTLDRFTVQNGLGLPPDADGSGIANGGILTLTNSTISGNGSHETGGSGGGIYNAGTLTLDSSVISNNATICTGGGVHSKGTFTSTDSTISDNWASTPYCRGSGLTNQGLATLSNTYVGDNDSETGILNNGTLTVNNSTVRGNTGSGIYHWDGTTTLNNSTISGNTAQAGGGVYMKWGAVILNNSTVSGNTADGDGGGIHNESGTLTLNSSTVSDNTASARGGGINNASDGTVTLQNTILAGNTAWDGPDGPDCSGTVGSSEYNLIGNTSGCTFAPTTGDLIDIDAMLLPLEGSPGFHPLSWTSPAINGGNPAGCTDHLSSLLLTDQRGKPRVGRCDIGAYEVMPLHFSSKAASDSAAMHGEPLTYTIAVNNIEIVKVSDILITDSLPISLTYLVDSVTADSGSYGYSGGVITWTGAVNAGDAVYISFGVTVSETVPAGAVITNSVVISGGWEIITPTIAVYVPIRIYLPIVMKGGG